MSRDFPAGIEAMRETLEYSSQWLEYGFLKTEQLEEQYQHFLSSEDKHTEHYRYGSFRQYLKERNQIEDEALNCYLELAERDADEGMSRSALLDLLQWHGLTSEQFERLTNSHLYFDGLSRKIILRQRLHKKIVQNMIPVDSFLDACLESKDTQIQREVLQSCTLTQVHLEKLASMGASKAVRNIAAKKIDQYLIKQVTT